MNTSKNSNACSCCPATTCWSLAEGDYVLATKYYDGDPQDHWCIGYYSGITDPHYDKPRFDVVDGCGKQFLGNGFRRVEKITPEIGAWMIKHAKEIKNSGISVWNFAKDTTLDA